MTNSITTTANRDRGYKTPAYVTLAGILLGATALATFSAPVAAKDLDVNAAVKNYLNQNLKAKSHVLWHHRLSGADWHIDSVKLERLRAKPVVISRPPGPYKAIAVKGVVLCKDEIHGDPETSVMQQIEFINTVSSKISVTKKVSTTTGTEATLTVGGEFGAPPKVGKVELSLAVSHQKTHGKSDTTSNTTTKTVRERSNVTLNGIGGKWAVLWARQHQMKNIPYTATFTPDPGDMVGFNLRSTGQVCVSRHNNYKGRGHCFQPNEHITKLGKYRMNDMISSLRASNGLYVTFFQHTGYGGKSWRVTGSHPKLHNWLNDSFSSLKVEGNRYVRIPYEWVARALPSGLKKFQVSGNITIDITQATQTKFAAVPMSATEHADTCNRTRAFGDSKRKRAGSKAAGKPSAFVSDVPAAKIKKMKFKAPK